MREMELAADQWEATLPLAEMKPPRRGFEPFHKYFSPKSSNYLFKPNMKLLFSLMPHLCRTKHSIPKLVLCPAAGVGAAPIMFLAYYTNVDSRVVVWEDDEEWREILVENLQRNKFCEGRWSLMPVEEVPEGVGDAGIFCPHPQLTGLEEFSKSVSAILETLYEKLKKGSRVVIVSRRFEIDLDNTFYTELSLESAVDTNLYDITQIGMVVARTPQRRLYNDEAQKDVFIILQRK